MSRKKPRVSGGIAVPKDATRAGKSLRDPGAALFMICYPLSRAGCARSVTSPRRGTPADRCLARQGGHGRIFGKPSDIRIEGCRLNHSASQ